MTRLLAYGALCWLASACASEPAPHPGAADSCVRDREGREVCVPPGPHRIACDDILCFESLWTLGESAAVVSMRRPTAVWIELAPNYHAIKLFEDANLEQLLLDRVDLAFIYLDTSKRELYHRAGIAALVAQSTTRDATDLEHFLRGQTESLLMYGQTLGPAALARAQRWVDYLHDKVTLVSERTRTLRPDQRPSAYYLRGPDPLTTHGVHTCTYWYAHLAGIDFVTGRSGMVTRSTTSAEQLVRWNPDIVLVGRLYSPALVQQDPRFRTLSAVEHGAVYALPNGIFFWDGGPESVLLMLWLAKTAHPQLFPDLDLTHEVRDYYARFYDLQLSDSQLDKLLSGRGPDGERTVRVNN